MKSLTHYIQEKLVIKKNKDTNYKYFPKTKAELKELIKSRIEGENRVDLNDIDVSNITDMSSLFNGFTNFNGDISSWDVSNVTDMGNMFYYCDSFNKDISNWDVSNVTDMNCIFYGCNSFNQDISNWDVSNVTDMSEMFYKCKINKKNKYKPHFK